MLEHNILSVSELTSEIKNLIESRLPYIHLEAEISNYKNHYSGHAYFSLKDENAQISAVMWRSNASRLNFSLEDGLKVIVAGRVSVYGKSGRYQIVVDSMEKAGKGDLQEKFERLKKKLFQKGYFDEKRKQTLPLFPKRIGIVTSPTGAALQDMLSVAERRNPSVELILRAAKVQGNDAAKDIAEAIRDLNDFADLDLIVIGRGGGSLEDLWAFNEEILADAIFESELPIVSAVGHEIDFSISDFVSDKRAATPSAAMELLIPSRDELRGQLAYYAERSEQLLESRLRQMKDKLNTFKQHYALKRPEELLLRKKELLNEVQSKIDLFFRQIIESKKQSLLLKQKELHALSPNRVLERGYSILEQNENVVSSIHDIQDGAVMIRMKDGKIEKRINAK